MMRTLYIKPFALYEVRRNACYQIMRYDLTRRDWDVLTDIFRTAEEAKEKIDELNEESGLVPFLIE